MFAPHTLLYSSYVYTSLTYDSFLGYPCGLPCCLCIPLVQCFNCHRRAAYRHLGTRRVGTHVWVSHAHLLWISLTEGAVYVSQRFADSLLRVEILYDIRIVVIPFLVLSFGGAWSYGLCLSRDLPNSEAACSSFRQGDMTLEDRVTSRTHTCA